MSRIEGISGLEPERSVFWEALEVIFKRRTFIFSVVFTVSVLTGISAFLLPKWYRATATVLPPDRGAVDMSPSSLFRGGLPVFGADLAIPLAASPSDVLAAMAASDAVLLGVAADLSLGRRYEISSTELLLRTVRENLTVKTTVEGIVQINYEDKDPKLAYDVVQSVLSNLDRVNQKRGSTKARATRLFVEARLKETEKKLEEAQDSLQAFQLAHKALDLDEQTRALVSSAAAVKAQLVADQIQLATLKKELAESHPEVQKLEARISAAEEELKKLETRGNKGSFLGVAMAALPGLTRELAVRLRNVAVQEKLFELLTEQYEQAKIQEAKDTPTISVLDYPRRPEFKIRPKRVKMALTGFFVSLLVALAFVFTEEYFTRMKTADPSRYRAVAAFASRIRAELPVLRKLPKNNDRPDRSAQNG